MTSFMFVQTKILQLFQSNNSTQENTSVLKRLRAATDSSIDYYILLFDLFITYTKK